MIDTDIITHLRQTLGEEALTAFNRDGYVFGWLIRPNAVRGQHFTSSFDWSDPSGPIHRYQYRYVCGECGEWWGEGTGPDMYETARMRAAFEAWAAGRFARECPHLAARLAPAAEGERNDVTKGPGSNAKTNRKKPGGKP